MENIEEKGKGIQYDHSKIADKHFFGGYLNLAQNNIDSVLNAFTNRFGLNKIGNIKIIDNLSDELSSSDYQNRLDFLKQYFPVVHYLDLPITDDRFQNILNDNKDYERRRYFRENFILLLNSINDLRHFYTHHFHSPLVFKEEFYSLVDTIFLSVVQEVKKRKMKDDKTRHLLKKTLNKELELLGRGKELKLKQEKAEGKKANLDKVSIKNAILNDAFYHLLYKKDEVNRNYKSKYNSESANEIKLSQSGLLFLLGMFLSKKESEDMRSRVTGYKAKVLKVAEEPVDAKNNSLKFMATHWVFSHLGFKGLKHRLSTGFSQEKLLIQIVDELSKVPDEVYRTFTKEQQLSFVEDINEFIKIGNETETLEDSIVVHPVIRKRYEDKFNYFVLRYLDEFADFPTLRFQVHLGNYEHDKRTKNIEGTLYKTDRVVKEKIKVFGKLAEVTNLKTEYLTTTNNSTTGWEIFPNPSYNFVSENIPVFIKIDDLTFKREIKKYKDLRNQEQKRKQRTENKLAKYEIIRLIGQKNKLSYDEPTAMLSLNELPALLYEMLIKGKTGAEIENRLVERLKERYQIISNFKKGDSLSTSQITKKLQKSDREKKIDIDKLIRAFQIEIAITDEKLLLIEKNRKEVKEKNENRKPKRKFVFTNKELGQEATWLAEDLKRFMPKSSRENWRGQHHSQLQQSLAYFNQKPKEAFALLCEFWAFDDNSKIKEAFDISKNFDQLYKNYLNNRKEVFSNIHQQLIGFKDDKKRVKQIIKQHNVWNIFYERLYTIHTTETQKMKLLAQPFVFPRGIFDEKPTYIKGKNISENPELFANWYQYCYQRHEMQRFYNFRRDYGELYENHKHTNKELSENKYNLTKQQQFDLFKRKQDKIIKQVMTQDILLKLVVEDLFQKIFENKQEVSLKDFYLTQEERLEKERTARLQSERKQGDSSSNIIKDNFIWSMTVPFVENQINEPAVKLKYVGKFKRFLTDEKVKRIFSYDEKRMWTKLELEQELELLPTSYEVIRREKLFKILQELEQTILQKWGIDNAKHPEELEQNGNPNFKRYISNGVLNKFNLANIQDINWLNNLNERTFEEVQISDLNTKSEIVQRSFLLVLIRNKFAHNQLPKKEYYELIKLLESEKYFINKDESYSTVILRFTKSTVSDFMSIMSLNEK